MEWFNGHFQDCGRMVVPEKTSASKEGGTGANDGQVVVRASSIEYLLTVLEVKNESGHSRDPLFQGCGYYQRFYMVRKGWLELRVSGSNTCRSMAQGCWLAPHTMSAAAYLLIFRMAIAGTRRTCCVPAAPQLSPSTCRAVTL